MLRSVGSIGLVVPFIVVSLAVSCTPRQDTTNTAANPPPPGYGAAPGYGAPPPGYGAPGYGAPGYGAPGYGAPAPGYTAPAPGYTAPAPSYPAPAPSYPAPAPSYPAPAPSTPATTPAPSAPAGLPSGFPWPFPAPGGTAPAPGGTAPASSGAATPIDPNLAGVATVPLLAYSQQEAPGMTREGGPVAAQFKEGQTLEQPFQLLPNKCYTVLAVGVGIQEVDLTIVAVTPIPQASGVLAQDSGTGSSASLGGRGNCFKWGMPIGINAKFVVRATRGSGMAAAQLYSK